MIDRGFAGLDYDTLPDAEIDLSCKSGGQVNPDVVVDVKQTSGGGGDEPETFEDFAKQSMEINSPAGAGSQPSDTDDSSSTNAIWVRLPVTEVVEWINKDGPADITRTARVKTPFEWGSESVIQFINGFNSQNHIREQTNPYDECRIFFYDRDISEWRVAHYGYVGGIGPAEESGVGKFWVYDPADLLQGIQVSQSWAEPTLKDVIGFALSGTDELGKDVGLTERSVFSGPIPYTIIGEKEIPKKKRKDVREEDTEGFKMFGQEVEKFEINGKLPVVGSFSVGVGDFVSDIANGIEENVVDPFLNQVLSNGQKRFQVNRHNMVDHLNWVASLVDGRWWFEPSAEGPVLMMDVTAFKSGAKKGSYERRYFVDDAVANQWEGIRQDARDAEIQNQVEDNINNLAPDFGISAASYQDSDDITQQLVNNGNVPDSFLPPHKYEVFGKVDVLNNNALADIKPFNTLTLYGESSFLGDISDTSSSPGSYTEEYPYVKVTYPPLVERAGGYEYSAQPIESDKVTLEGAEQEAKKKFRKHLAEQTEGSMEIRGEPHVRPHDYIVSVPVCNDTYPNVGAQPLTWEINGVKHIRRGGEQYRTELGVSLTLNDSLLEVESEYRES